MLYFYSCFVSGNENLRCYGVIEGNKIKKSDDFFELLERALNDDIIPKMKNHAHVNVTADKIVFVTFNPL